MIKQILYLVAAFLLGIATYAFIDTALTTFRWQIKAVTISNLLNTPTEAWWSVNPLKIALSLSLEDMWTVLQITGATVTYVVGRWVR
jgi:hypothetical protein